MVIYEEATPWKQSVRLVLVFGESVHNYSFLCEQVGIPSFADGRNM